MKWSMLAMTLVLSCSAATQQRLAEIEVEKDKMQRHLTVCSVAFPHEQKYCHRVYGRKLHDLRCEEARLRGERCADVYVPE